MDRILQALQRARQENGTGAATLPPDMRVRARGSGGDAREYPSSRPRANEDVPIAYTSTRTIAVSQEFLRANRVMAGNDRGPAVDAYKVLSTQVLQRLRENRWNALAVVSAGFREGKTLTAINLAISLSREVGHTVLLVDADLRRPGIHRYFGVPAEPGLSEHLIDGLPLDRLLFNPGIEGLVVLPGGRPLQTSSELLGSPKMHSLVQELKRRYPSRIVLFDLPPVLSAADALAFAPYVDATIMVVEEGRTAGDDVIRAAEMLETTNLIGTVLNNSNYPGLHEEVHAAPRRSMLPGKVPSAKRGAAGWFARLTGRGG